MIAAAHGVLITPSAAFNVLSIAALTGAGVFVFRGQASKAMIGSLREQVGVYQSSVKALEQARADDKAEAAEEAKRIALQQLDQERKCSEDINNLKGQVAVLTSDTLDRLVGAATTALAAAMHSVASEQSQILAKQSEALRAMDEKLTTGVETVNRIEAATGSTPNPASVAALAADA